MEPVATRVGRLQAYPGRRHGGDLDELSTANCAEFQRVEAGRREGW